MNPKLFSYQFTEAVFDFRMPGNRSNFPIFRVLINVVPLPMSLEKTPGFHKFPNQITSFHNSSSTSFT